MLEKPIGSDSESAEEIISTIGQWIDEDRVFRLDHYLGKAAVQNLIALRFGNTLLEAVWNRNYIESVHIRWPKAKAWMAAMPITPAPARCGTWCRATSCSCCAWWRWNRRHRWKPIASATRRSRCCAPCARSMPARRA